MSKRTKSMRLDETGIRITPDAVIAHNASGEAVAIYIRHKPPLDLWLNNGLPRTLYQAGVRYGEIWRQACRPKSPPHSDPTRVVVDGNSAAPEHELSRGVLGEFSQASSAVGDQETTSFLNRLCGLEDWPVGDKRRFKRICRKGLERLADHWRRR